MNPIIVFFILGFSFNTFSQNLQIMSPIYRERPLTDQNHEQLSNEEIWLAAYLATKEIKNFLEAGGISREQAEKTIDVVFQIATQMTETGLVKVEKSNHPQLARHMLGGCIAMAFAGASAGLYVEPSGVLAGGIVGCFLGISVGVLTH